MGTATLPDLIGPIAITESEILDDLLYPADHRAPESSVEPARSPEVSR